MTRSILIAAGIVSTLMLAITAWAWGQVPDGAQIPIHWGAGGEANGFASKEIGLLMMPAMALGVGVLLAVVPAIDPRRGNLLRSLPAYRAVAFVTLLLLLVLHLAAVLAATGRDIDMPRIVVVGVGLMFLVIGNYLGKTRSTWFFGIRTPWTLTSERSWTLTHRLGGYLFAGLGAIMIVVGAISPEVLAWALLPGLAIAVGVPVVYSYLVWRNDPDRIQMER